VKRETLSVEPSGGAFVFYAALKRCLKHHPWILTIPRKSSVTCHVFQSFVLFYRTRIS